MFLALASSSALAAVASAALSAAPMPAAPVHSAEITHGQRAYVATYSTQPIVHLRQMDPIAAMRQVHTMCRWQADIVVNRAVESNGAAVPAVGKAIHHLRPASGIVAGRCADAEGQVAREVARHSAARTGEAMEAARRDHGLLTAEISDIHALTRG